MSEGTGSFGDLLRRFRTASSLSQEELAERSGLSARGISDLERGARQVPRLETVRMLADALALGTAERMELLSAARPTLLQNSPADPAPARPVFLPTPLTRLIDREAEATALHATLGVDDVRLVTLTGPGGTGKTRLALAVATEAHNRYDDGVFFVDLAPLTDPALVMPAIAAALGVREIPGQRAFDVLVESLAFKRLLVLLDNFEQVLAAAPEIAALLASSPGLTVLATSREPLHIRGEREFPVPPLPLPAIDALVSIDVLARIPAVTLFVERAAASVPHLTLSPDNASDVSAICRRLDGLPLAIELAAARARVLSPAAILARLEQRLPLLTSGSRDLPPRQRTMRSAIAWSYDLLAEHDQRFFRRLAVFIGGFTLPAAEAVAGEGTADVIEGIAAVTAASLVLRMPPSRGAAASEPRFGMFETIREFALDELVSSGDDEPIRRRHLHYVVALAEEAEGHFIRGVAPEWLDVLETEHDNIRAALAWALTTSRGFEDRASGLRLAGTLWLFWYYHSHLREGRRWLERALDLETIGNARAPERDRMRALVGLGALAHFQGDDDAAVRALEESVPLGRLANDPVDLAYALTILGNVAEDSGAYQIAEERFREAYDLFVRIDDSVNVAVTTYHLGVVKFGQGDLSNAIRLCEEALAISRRSGDPWTTATAQSYIGLLRATTGEHNAAIAALSEALTLYHQLGTKERIAEVIRRVAVLAAALGRSEQTLRLFAAADAMSGEIGAAQALPEREAYDRARLLARSALNDADARRATASGEGLDSDGIQEEIQDLAAAIVSGANA